MSRDDHVVRRNISTTQLRLASSRNDASINNSRPIIIFFARNEAFAKNRIFFAIRSMLSNPIVNRFPVVFVEPRRIHRIKFKINERMVIPPG